MLALHLEEVSEYIGADVSANGMSRSASNFNTYFDTLERAYDKLYNRVNCLPAVSRWGKH
jgi:hypothetical protein